MLNIFSESGGEERTGWGGGSDRNKSCGGGERGGGGRGVEGVGVG